MDNQANNVMIVSSKKNIIKNVPSVMTRTKRVDEEPVQLYFQGTPGVSVRDALHCPDMEIVDNPDVPFGNNKAKTRYLAQFEDFKPIVSQTNNASQKGGQLVPLTLGQVLRKAASALQRGGTKSGIMKQNKMTKRTTIKGLEMKFEDMYMMSLKRISPGTVQVYLGYFITEIVQVPVHPIITPQLRLNDPAPPSASPASIPDGQIQIIHDELSSTFATAHMPPHPFDGAAATAYGAYGYNDDFGYPLHDANSQMQSYSPDYAATLDIPLSSQPPPHSLHSLYNPPLDSSSSVAADISWFTPEYTVHDALYTTPRNLVPAATFGWETDYSSQNVPNEDDTFGAFPASLGASPPLSFSF